MKKMMAIFSALALSLALAACGGSASSSAAPVSSAAPAPASSAMVSSAPSMAESALADSASAADSALNFELDAQAITDAVAVSYLGLADSGEPVLLGFDETGEGAVLIYVDPASQEAASFVGSITDNGDETMTINELSGLTLTFGITQTGDTTYDLDVGDMGMISVEEVDNATFAETLQTVVDNYTFVA